MLKIDRSFVKDLPDDRDAGVLVETMITMARKLGIQCLAEGIETEAQLDVPARPRLPARPGLPVQPAGADRRAGGGRLSRAQRAVAPTVAARASGLRESVRRTTRAPVADEAAASASHIAS